MAINTKNLGSILYGKTSTGWGVISVTAPVIG